MSFKSYQASVLPNHTWALAAPLPLRLSGKHGLIARHVQAVGLANLARWSLTDVDLPRLLESSPSPDRWIVFEQTEDTEMRLSRVLRINGIIAHGQTELLVTLSPLNVVRSMPGLVVTAPADARAWNEELALDGSPDRRDSTWSWCDRALHVGATVLGTRSQG